MTPPAFSHWVRGTRGLVWRHPGPLTDVAHEGLRNQGAREPASDIRSARGREAWLPVLETESNLLEENRAGRGGLPALWESGLRAKPPGHLPSPALPGTSSATSERGLSALPKKWEGF